MTDSLHVVCPQCDGINRLSQIKLGAGGKCGICHQPLFPGKPLELNQTRFQRHLAKSDIPLLVDFWASWCGPCKIEMPTIEKLIGKIKSDKFKYLKINKIVY